MSKQYSEEQTEIADKIKVLRAELDVEKSTGRHVQALTIHFQTLFFLRKKSIFVHKQLPPQLKLSLYRYSAFKIEKT